MFEILLPIHDSHDLIAAREEGRRAARELGATPLGETLAATVVSELVRNVLEHAGGGEVRITAEDRALSIVTLDCGPGIQDFPRALGRGYSTSGGAGLGLAAVAQVADCLELTQRLPHGLRVRAIVPAGRLSSASGPHATDDRGSGQGCGRRSERRAA